MKLLFLGLNLEGLPGMVNSCSGRSFGAVFLTVPQCGSRLSATIPDLQLRTAFALRTMATPCSGRSASGPPECGIHLRAPIPDGSMSMRPYWILDSGFFLCTSVHPHPFSWNVKPEIWNVKRGRSASGPLLSKSIAKTECGKSPPKHASPCSGRSMSGPPECGSRLSATIPDRCPSMRPHPFSPGT